MALLHPHHHIRSPVPVSDLLSYEREGFLVCRGLLPPPAVERAAQALARVARRRRLDALRQRVRVLVGPGPAARVQTEQEAERLLRRSETGVGFFQHFNLHRQQRRRAAGGDGDQNGDGDDQNGGSGDQNGDDLAAAREAVRAIAFSHVLTRAAAALLGVDGGDAGSGGARNHNNNNNNSNNSNNSKTASQGRVRLYQTCAFVKEGGHGPTHWHSDLRMAPFDANAFVTAWVPLRAMGGESTGDSGLVFAAGSHRDFALPFWRSRALLEAEDLSARGYALRPQGAMAIGDASFHHGWLLHAAGRQPRGSEARIALAVSYFADGARVRAIRGDAAGAAGAAAAVGRGEDEDAESVADWIGEVKPGAVARHPLLPVVWDGGAAATGAGGGGRGGGVAGRGRAAAGGARGGAPRRANGGGGRFDSRTRVSLSRRI